MLNITWLVRSRARHSAQTDSRLCGHTTLITRVLFTGSPIGLSAATMSWLADLAGKAEDLLNRVDQGAATALSRKENTGSSIYSRNTDCSELHQQNADSTYQTGSKANYISSAADNVRNQRATLLAGTTNVKAGPRTSVEASHSGENSSVPRPSAQFVRRKKSEPDDELLFDFLNSSQKEPTGRVEIKKERGRTPVLQSSQTTSASAENTSVTAIKTIEENPGSQSHGS